MVGCIGLSRRGDQIVAQKMDKEAIQIRYGIDPESVGYDNRGFDIVEEIGPEEMEAGA